MIYKDNSQSFVVKVLVIVGFFATIALLVWLLIQGARVLPGAFASLASLADSLKIGDAKKELTIGIEKNIVNSGESFTISWTNLEREGTYTFAPLCVNGASVSVRSADGSFVTVPCTETLSLPYTVDGLFLTIHTKDHRFTEVPFTISFESTDKKTRYAESARVTVVNATVPVEGAPKVGTSTTTRERTDTPTAVAPKPVSTPTPAPAPKPIVTTQVVTYMPTSDPRGYTDLGIRFMGIGEMNGSTFIARTEYEEGERGGFRFAVKNSGTKTSEEWTFTARLPGGVTYTSKDQAPLLPNEEAVLTIGFDVPENADRTETVKIQINVTDDTKTSNDTLSWSVKVRN